MYLQKLSLFPHFLAKNNADAELPKMGGTLYEELMVSHLILMPILHTQGLCLYKFRDENLMRCHPIIHKVFPYFVASERFKCFCTIFHCCPTFFLTVTNGEA